MRIEVNLKNVSCYFETTQGLFSPSGADRGTVAMLSVADLQPGMRVLDLGCGWGMVGVFAAKLCGAHNVLMCDIDPAAVEAANFNAAANGVEEARAVVSDGLRDLDATGFDVILSNPPYQTNFSVAKHFIEKGFNRLNVGGSFYMVTKRREWYKNKIISIFGGVKIHEIDGYYVFEAQKRQQKYAYSLR